MVGAALGMVVGGVVTAVRVIGGLVGSVWSLMSGDYGTVWERFKGVGRTVAEGYPRPDRAQAEAHATARLGPLTRRTATLELTLPGDPAVVAGGRVESCAVGARQPTERG